MAGFRKRSGLVHAVTDEGVRLPVIDLTKPDFAVDVGPAELEELADRVRRELKDLLYLPPVVRQAMSHNSLLMDDPTTSRGFMTGMTTYVHKLGPGRLPARCSALDRRLAASAISVALRLRLRAVAELLAEALVSAGTTHQDVPVHLVNIGGGPAADSLNALVLADTRDGRLLHDRSVQVHLFDLDEAGPHFADRCLAALTGVAGPLPGLRASTRYTRYDWTDPSVLVRELTPAVAGEAIVVGSSEGGLLEYGSDEDIAGNLRALHDATGTDAVFVGSSLRDREVQDVMNRLNQGLLISRTVEQLTALADAAGWAVDRVVHGGPVHQVLRLRKQ